MSSSSRENLPNSIYLDEVTHFEKPTKLKKQLPMTITYKGSNNVSRTVTIAPLKGANNNKLLNMKTTTRSNNNESDFSSDSESDTVYGNNNVGGTTGGVKNNNTTVEGNCSRPDSILPLEDDDNLFPLSTLNSINVTWVDFVFTFVVFLIVTGSLGVDIGLCVWHYQDGLMWASGLTAVCICLGSMALLQQFNVIQLDQLNRIFRHGKRVRILVNCFPPLASILTSLQSAMVAFRASKDPMLGTQFFQTELVSKNLGKVQSFFHSAPQAVLQIIVLILNGESSASKLWFTLVCILLSLIVMTCASLPSKCDDFGTSDIPKAVYSPKSRVFIGIRMFSNFASRAMALSYCFIGFLCLKIHSPFTSILIPIALLLLIRFSFIILECFRKRNVSDELNLSSLCMSYIATIYFPVGDPFWLFWYMSIESGLFVSFGCVVSWFQSDCISTLVVWLYPVIFIMLFFIVPAFIPYAKATVKTRQMEQTVKKITNGLSRT